MRLNSWIGSLLVKFSPSYRLSHHFKGFQFYGGQQWFVMHALVAQKMLEFLDQNPNYRLVFKYAFAPDELFFQTLYMNLAKTNSWELVNAATHFVRFNGVAANPDYLSQYDLDVIPEKDQYLFARKYRYESA